MKKNKEINSAVTKFLLCSLFGVFFFFIQIDIQGNNRIPADHLIALLKVLLKDWYLYIILVLAGYSVVKCLLSKRMAKSSADLFFFVQSALGFALCMLIVLGLLPEAMMEIARSAVTATGNILCAIFLTSLFIPFLTEYGLVDFVGVICQPFMRRVFLTPGSSAVIGVSAFLGNYSMGHVISKQMYDDGRFTEKESVIVAVGFSTCSIGLMINLVNYLDLMPHWGLYVASVLIVTFLTTIVTARIPPIRGKKEEYKPGVSPVAEPARGDRLFYRAYCAGVEKAAGAPGLLHSVRDILGRVFPIICEITGTSIFIIPLGMFLAEYTDIFSYIGTVFYPLLRLVGVDGASAALCSGSIGISILEPVLAGVVADGETLPMLAKWIVAIVPYSSIIFFAGFVPSLWKSGISCKVHEMLILWLERVIIGILLSALLGNLFIWCGLL